MPRISQSGNLPLISGVDSVQIPVPQLHAALSFYRDRLGHEVLWQHETAVGLRIPGTRTEIVLQVERPDVEIDLKVASVATAVDDVVAAGGRVIEPPFEVQTGLCAIVADPWGNHLFLIDSSKGTLRTNKDGEVTGLRPVQR